MTMISLRCIFPDGLIPSLVGSDELKHLNEQDVRAAARGVLDFLIDQGGTTIVVNQDTETSRDYQAIIPGVEIQVRMNKVLLDSIRDWIVLVVVLASVAHEGKNVPGAILGAAIASFVRAVLGNVHKLDERVGERCIVKAIITAQNSLGEDRAIDQKEIANQLAASTCVLANCKYSLDNVCTLSEEELDGLLEQMTKAEILTRAGATAYRLA